MCLLCVRDSFSITNHAAGTGEERFSVCYEGGRNGQVWFDMLSFSKGSFPLGRLLMPLIRPLQHRFFSDLGAAMQRAVLE